LSRKEIEAEVIFDKKATPSKENIKKELAKQLKAEEKLVVVKSIDGSYGSNQAKVTAYQYINEEDMKAIEPKPKEAKKEGEAPKKAPKPEAKKEKAKPEAKKEKAKPEEKKKEPKKE